MSEKKYCIKNERTNRCILSKEQNDSSQFCELSETTKKCKNMTKKRTTPPARNKSVKTSNTSNTSNTSKKSNTIEYHGFLVNPGVKRYLDKLIFNIKSVKKFRDIAEDNNLEINVPFKVKNTDMKLKVYLMHQVLSLSRYMAKDTIKRNQLLAIKDVVVSLKIVKQAINNDPELKMLFE